MRTNTEKQKSSPQEWPHRRQVKEVFGAETTKARSAQRESQPPQREKATPDDCQRDWYTNRKDGRDSRISA